MRQCGLWCGAGKSVATMPTQRLQSLRAGFEWSPGTLCDCCRFNDTIPDLSKCRELGKWCRLETAKRRLFYDLERVGAPVWDQASTSIDPPLTFDFKADLVPVLRDSGASIGRVENSSTPGNARRPDHDQHSRGRRRTSARSCASISARPIAR